MTGFDDRKKAHETKFASEEEKRFKIASRRRKLLGIWAGEYMGMNEETSLKYALEIVGFGIDNTEDGAVINKIINDAKERKADLPEDVLRKKNNELEEVAKIQIMQG